MDFMIVSRAQHIVLTKVLGVKKVYAVIGFSMGAQQVSSIWFSHQAGLSVVLGVLLARRVPGLCWQVRPRVLSIYQFIRMKGSDLSVSVDQRGQALTISGWLHVCLVDEGSWNRFQLPGRPKGCASSFKRLWRRPLYISPPNRSPRFRQGLQCMGIRTNCTLPAYWWR